MSRALQKALENESISVFKKLIWDEEKLDVQVKKWSYTPLHFAAAFNEIEIVKFLVLTRNINVNIQNIYGETPLLYAIKNNKISMVKCLIELGARVDIKNPIYYALKDNYLDIAKFLKDQPDCDVNIQANDVFLEAIIQNNFNRVKLLINNFGFDINFQNKEGKSPIFYAKSFTMIKFLVELGADLNLTDKSNNHIIHYMITSPNILEFLIENGANVNAQTSLGSTPLMLAIVNRSKESIKLLLKKSDVNIQNIKGKTALMYSIKYYEEVFYDILNKSNVYLQDEDGLTALNHAIQNRKRSFIDSLEEKIKNEIKLTRQILSSHHHLYSDIIYVIYMYSEDDI
jgi:ankyrin repeat protein